MNQRILELALEELERKKTAIDSEIQAIRFELGESKTAGRTKAVAPVAGRRRGRSSTERKAQSERMKKYWAARRAGSASGKKAAAASPKPRKSANKAISEAMRVYWAKKKAVENVKTK